MHSPSKSAKVCQNLSNSVNFPQMLKNLVKRKLLYSASPSSISARLQQLYNIYQNICIFGISQTFLFFPNLSFDKFLPKGLLLYPRGSFPLGSGQQNTNGQFVGESQLSNGPTGIQESPILYLYIAWLIDQHFKRMKNMPKVIVKLLSIKYAIKVELPRTIWDSNLKLGWSAV